MIFAPPLEGTGLACRAPEGCEFVVQVRPSDSMDALKLAVAQRNAHERENHEYVHVPRVERKWGYGK